MRCFHQAAHDVTEQQHQQMDVVKVNDDNDASSLQALIEKVVNDEIKKLAHETSEVIKLGSDVISTATDDTSADSSTEPEQTESSVTTEPPNIVSETETGAPEVEDEVPQTEPAKVSEDASTTTTTEGGADEESATDDGISDSLLSAVGDLLSSILGLDASGEADTRKTYAVDDEIVVKMEDADGDVIFQEKIASTLKAEAETTTVVFEPTEADIELSTEKAEETTPNFELPTTVLISDLHLRDKEMSEIDLKIENLANFGTEQVTELLNEIKAESDMLELLPAMTDEAKPVSFEDRINQVMSVVKESEGRLPVESVVDSILIDKHIKENVNDLDQIVYGTLMEIESNLGLSGGVDVPFEPTERSDFNKDFESGISKTLLNQNMFDYGSFLPNSAKAALYYKQEDGTNF